VTTALRLADCDASAGTLVDTDIWVDCLDPASPWHDGAINPPQACSERLPLHINLIIYTEPLVPGPDIAALDAMLDAYDTHHSALPSARAQLTAAAFSIYRCSGGTRLVPMPDFFIGTHAAVAKLGVLTRDPAPYRRHFPRLAVRAP
jgi:predicted nucleic acid-binding protein